MTATPVSSWMEVVSHLDPKYGGLSSSVPALGEHIAHDQSMDISIAGFCSQDEQYRPYGYDPTHLSYWPVSRKPWLTDRLQRASMAAKFKDRLRGVDGVHIHGLWEQSTSTAASTARALRKPYIVSAHGMLEPWALKNRRLKKLIYSFLVERGNVARAACLHALTRAEARQYIEFGARSPIVVIPNGVDIPEASDPEAFFEQFPSLREGRIVLFLGRLHRKKGLHLLLESWAAVSASHSDSCLVLAGPDCEGTKAELEDFVVKHDLTSRVVFAGMLQGAMKWSAYAAAELFVLPSYSEGLSVSVLEAMGMGVPVVVSKECNMPEVEEQGAGREIHAVKSELISALNEFLSQSRTQNAAIGARGAALVRTRYAWPKIARQMTAVYRWLVGGEMPHDVEVIYPEGA